MKKITFEAFMDNEKDIDLLSLIPMEDPSVKMRIFKIKKWSKESTEMFEELIKAVDDNLPIPEGLKIDEHGVLVSGDKQAYIDFRNNRDPKIKKILDAEIDLPSIELFNLSELSEIKTFPVSAIETINNIELLNEDV